MTTQRSHVAEVQTYFDTPNNYLDRRRFDIRIRSETVQELTRGRTFWHALDIGCGDGSIAVPLLPRCRRLTLMDISPAMLALARRNIGDDAGVVARNENFIDSHIEDEEHDLVLCLGVLAHVDSPESVIAKISRILMPGGSLILEVTDSFHPMGRAIAVYHGLLDLVRPATYPLNRLRGQDIVRICRKYGLGLSSFYQYALPLPGSHRLFDHETLYAMTRSVFGTADRNRNRWLGNIFIYRLVKMPDEP